MELLLSSLNTCIAKIGLNTAAIASYESNSFYTDKDVYALANISELFYQQHEDNKDVYDAMNGISKQTLDLASEGFDTEQNKSNSNNDVNYLLEIIIKLLKVIADKGDTGNDFSDRDFIRMLKSLGVVFS